MIRDDVVIGDGGFDAPAPASSSTPTTGLTTVRPGFSTGPTNRDVIMLVVDGQLDIVVAQSSASSQRTWQSAAQVPERRMRFLAL